jgi:hypothetical protein
VRFLRIVANVVALAAAAAAGVVLAIGDPAKNENMAIWGSCLAGLALTFQILLLLGQERTKAETRTLSTRYQFALNQAITPVLQHIAHMGAMTPARRKTALDATATQIVNSLILVLAERHKEARATAFTLDPQNKEAVVLATFGGALSPDTIDLSTDRGKLARKAMENSSRLFPSVRTDPDAWPEKDTEYDGRIVSPITVPQRGAYTASVYGLLMYEVQDGKELTKGDKEVVDVFASAAATAISLL